MGRAPICSCRNSFESSARRILLGGGAAGGVCEAGRLPSVEGGGKWRQRTGNKRGSWKLTRHQRRLR